MRTILSFVTAIAALTVVSSRQADASHETPLARAACAYRDAVIHFGHELMAEHRLSHRERRLAPQLVDTAGRLYVASRHSHLSHHLRSTWYEIEALHAQVEAVVFGHPGCPVYVSLRPCWDEVLCAYNDLAIQLARMGCHTHRHSHLSHYAIPRHGLPAYPPTGAIVLPGTPALNVPNYRYRSAIVPSYRYGNYGHRVVPPASQILSSPSEQQMSEAERPRVRSRSPLPTGGIGAILSRTWN